MRVHSGRVQKLLMLLLLLLEWRLSTINDDWNHDAATIGSRALRVLLMPRKISAAIPIVVSFAQVVGQ
jgi:hypothetical protein